MKVSLGATTILLPTPTLVVGTYDELGRHNVMTAAWGGICCSVSPCVSVSLRKATYTYGNLLARRAFTISIPSQLFVREADFFGIASGRDTDKFAVTGLTPVRSEVVDAPYVGEFPLVVECALRDTLEIGLHTLFVGEVLDVKVDDDCRDERGNLDPGKVRACIYAPAASAYYAFGEQLGKGFVIGREAYGRG